MDRSRPDRLGWIVIGLCCALVVTQPAAAERASDGINGGGTGISARRTETGGSVTVGAQRRIETPGRSAHRGGGVATTTCSYRTVDAAPFGPGAPTGPDAGPVGTLTWRTCVDAATGAAIGVPSLVASAAPGAPATPFDPVPDLVDLATANIDVDLPEPRFSPPGATLPNVDTFLWTAPHDDPTASASAAGVTVTVTATPERTRFHIEGVHGVPSRDDGRTVECAGRPAPYDPARPTTEQASSCRYRFHTPTRDLDVDVTTTWRLTWTATTGASGDLGGIDRTVTVPYRVQAAATVIR